MWHSRACKESTYSILGPGPAHYQLDEFVKFVTSLKLLISQINVLIEKGVQVVKS